MRSLFHSTLVAFLTVGLLWSCTNGPTRDVPTVKKIKKADKLQGKAKALFGIAKMKADINSPLAQLGKELYYEPQLSMSGTRSCNTCHQLEKFGVDHETTASSPERTTKGERNAPTVYYAFTHSSQFWDGSAKNLEEQVKGHVLDPRVMGMPDERSLEDKLKASENYPALFAQAFPEESQPVSFHNMAIAIAAFEKTLVSPGRFDEYLSGNAEALSIEERKGLQAFIDVGCTTCHTGPSLGGQMFQKFGLAKGPYWEYTGSEVIDSGRATLTGSRFDQFSFKVSGLRNIAMTAPYFHDGSVTDLSEAVKIMAVTQLGKELSEEELKNMVAFMESLSGDIPDYALKTTGMD